MLFKLCRRRDQIGSVATVRRRRARKTNVKELLGFFDLPLSFQRLKIEPRLTTQHEGRPRERGCQCIHINASV